MKRTVAALALVLTAASPAVGHDIEQAEALLAAIAAHQRTAASGPTPNDREDALFRLGETADTLVEALNRDVTAHGRRDLFAELVVRRLQAQSVNVTWASPQGRYTYDLTAFHEYLRRAPRGPWAAAAKFRIMAQRFYATLGTDPAALVGTDVARLLQAVAEAERFLGQHGAHERAGTVRFFLAVDHYRIARNVADPARSAEHQRRARQALQQTVERSTEVFEVRAAQALLESLGADGTRQAR